MFRQILNLLPATRASAASADSSTDQAVAIAEAAEPAATPQTLAATPQLSADRPSEEMVHLARMLDLNRQATGKCGGTGANACYKPVSNSENENAVSAARAELAPLPKIVNLGNGAYYTDITCKSIIPAAETTYMTCYVRMPIDK
jgi:hypothetical protein